MANSVPESNKKIFAIATLVAIVAVLGFTILASKNGNVDKAVMKEEVDPSKVFDAPYLKANLFYIDLEKFSEKTDDPQSIGCGDGVVAYEIPVGEGNGPTKSDALTFVLAQLFNNSVFEQLKTDKADNDVKPYNTLASSTISLKSLKEIPGEYEVRLVGNPKLGGVCDTPRLQAQLEKTIQPIFAPDTAKIYLNDKLLSEALSAQ